MGLTEGNTPIRRNTLGGLDYSCTGPSGWGNFCPSSGPLFPIHLEASILLGSEDQGGACRGKRRWDPARQDDSPQLPHHLY